MKDGFDIRPSVVCCPLPRLFIIHPLSFILLFVSGCAGYQLGNGTLYPADIQTVYVPMFESDSFRRGLGRASDRGRAKGDRAQDALQGRGHARTADSVLSGRIKEDTKHTLVKNKFDDPREVEVGLPVEVHWLNRKGDLIGQTGTVPIPGSLTEITETATLVPEYGQSITTAQQVVIDRLATQIVGMMEAPW